MSACDCALCTPPGLDPRAVARRLSRVLAYQERAAFIGFAAKATIGHWAEVIAEMEHQLKIEGRDPKTGKINNSKGGQS